LFDEVNDQPVRASMPIGRGRFDGVLRRTRKANGQLGIFLHDADKPDRLEKPKQCADCGALWCIRAA